MNTFKQFLVEKKEHKEGEESKSSKETGDAAEVEAADVLRHILPSKYKVSRGKGKTDEGAVAPDIIIHTEEHIHRDGKRTTLKHPTKIAHALMTQKKGKWTFTIVAHKHVHKSLSKHAPEMSKGLRMFIRKRPQGTNKNKKSKNHGKADVPLSVYWKPENENSIPSVTIHEQGEVTQSGRHLAQAIQDHVDEFGPLVIDIKKGGDSQLSNITFHGHRESKDGPVHVSFEGSSLPEHSRHRLEHTVSHHSKEHLHNYMDRIGELTGREIHDTKLRKYRKSMVHPDNIGHNDIPEEDMDQVSFHHHIGSSDDAVEALRASYDRPVSGFEIHEHKPKGE